MPKTFVLSQCYEFEWCCAFRYLVVTLPHLIGRVGGPSEPVRDYPIADYFVLYNTPGSLRLKYVANIEQPSNSVWFVRQPRGIRVYYRLGTSIIDNSADLAPTIGCLGYQYWGGGVCKCILERELASQNINNRHCCYNWIAPFYLFFRNAILPQRRGPGMVRERASV